MEEEEERREVRRGEEKSGWKRERSEEKRGTIR